MHDIDRTQTEYPYEEMEAYEFDEMEFEASETVFDEATEMELTSDLLEVVDDAELDQFLGKLFKKAGRTLGRFVRSPTGRALGGALKGVAKMALPAIGGALGTAVAPGLGTAVGGALGHAAGQLFGLELEGLSPEDQEFEVARRFVRLAGNAVEKATTLSPAIDPGRAAKIALSAAAGKHAPGLLAAPGRGPAIPAAKPASFGLNSGRWVRRGRRIVLLGV